MPKTHMTSASRHRDDPNRGVMGLGDHLEELRRRVIWGALGLLPIFSVGLIVADPALKLLARPVRGALLAAGQPSGLIATSPLETFLAWLKIGVVITVAAGFPWLLIQAWLFIAPGLYAAERRFVYVLIPGSAALSMVAIAFLYLVMLPVSLYFLVNFGADLARTTIASAPLPEGVRPESLFGALVVLQADPPPDVLAPGMMWLNEDVRQIRLALPDGKVANIPLHSDALVSQQFRIESYIGLVFWLGTVFVLAFQLPLVMLIAGWTGLLRASDLTRRRRPIYFGMAVAGALLTPQDPWTMLILGGALIVLFELGIWLMRIPPSALGSRPATDADEEA